MTGTTSSVRRDPEILGGTPVLVGTRVPLQNLIALSAGDTRDDILRSFPPVTSEQAVAALRQGADILEQRAIEVVKAHRQPPSTGSSNRARPGSGTDVAE